jgi:segregation and condensation protein B
MENTEKLKPESKVEAVLFASGEAVLARRLAILCDVLDVEGVVDSLNNSYRRRSSSLQILKLGNAYQLTTRPEYATLIRNALEQRKGAPLSNAAMEVLAIAAFNQPVTRGFIEDIRGVDSTQIVSSLVEKGLLEEAGRLEVPGRPISFRTTDVFLRSFSVGSIDELKEMLPDMPTQQDEELPLQQALDFTSNSETNVTDDLTVEFSVEDI